MAQVILSNKQSNSGSPYVIYSIEVTPSNRTMTTVDLAFKITSHLKYDDSKLQTGAGYGLKGKLVINGQTLWWDDDTSREGYRTYNAPILKGRWNSWSGKTNHNVYYTYTLNNLAWDTTSIPVTFYVIRTSGNTSNAGYLNTTNCTNISIDRGAAPSTISSISSGTTDYAPSIVWTPLDSSFKFKLRYFYGSWEHYTDFISPNTTNAYTYNGYTINGSTLAPYMTNVQSATFGLTLYTYDSSGNYIGENNGIFSVTLNSNIIPSVSFSQVAEAGDVPSSWGVYVRTKSRIALALSASGIYGSSISSYRISYYGGAVTTQSATTSYIQNSGNITFTGQVSDTRGRSASTTTTINVVDYYNPTISTAQVQRCDANGNIDKNGEYMYISYGASISSCSNKNTPSAVYKVGYRVHNTGNYTYINLTTNANSYSASGMLFSDGIKAPTASGTKVQFSTNNTYDIQFYVKDYFMEYTNVQTLDAGFDLMNFNPSGKAMAIGKVSEAGANEELLEVALPTKIYDLAALTTNNIAGYSMDVYGNFHHLRSSANDEWELFDSNGNIRMRYIWESGVLKLNNGVVISETELFSGDSNSPTLSDSVSNYTYLEIWYRSNDGTGHQGYTKVYAPQGKQIVLRYSYYNSYLYEKESSFYIWNNTITQQWGVEWYINTSNQVTMGTASNISITRVVGCK